MLTGEIKEISSKTASDFLLPRHYSGRIPSISYAFGWYVGESLQAVCTFGKPASNALCCGLCGKEYSSCVYELNRLCREENFNQPLSHFVGKVLRMLKPKNIIIVSYSDTAMHHNGYIYQACNFLYTGQTAERTDIFTGIGKHSRHYTNEEKERTVRVVRSAKNRYVYFCTSDKKLKRTWEKALKYPIQPYPKAENQNYVLGEYIKPKYVFSRQRSIEMKLPKDLELDPSYFPSTLTISDGSRYVLGKDVLATYDQIIEENLGVEAEQMFCLILDCASDELLPREEDNAEAEAWRLEYIDVLDTLKELVYKRFDRKKLIELVKQMEKEV